MTPTWSRTGTVNIGERQLSTLLCSCHNIVIPLELYYIRCLLLGDHFMKNNTKLRNFISFVYLLLLILLFIIEYYKLGTVK